MLLEYFFKQAVSVPQYCEEPDCCTSRQLQLERLGYQQLIVECGEHVALVTRQTIDAILPQY